MKTERIAKSLPCTLTVNGIRGAFMEPVLLRCTHPETSTLVHEIEVFGPLATVIGYGDVDQAIDLARRGGGSLVGSLFSEDADFCTRVTFGVAPYHGRLMVMNAKAAPHDLAFEMEDEHLTWSELEATS